MTIKLELNAEVEARLKAEASAQGLPLETMAERLLKEALTKPQAASGKMSAEEFRRMLDAMAQGSGSLPDLPTKSFSRESFYEDRLDGRDPVPHR